MQKERYCNFSPNDKILNLSKLKAAADNKIGGTQELILGRKLCGKRRKGWLPAKRVENIIRKEKKCWLTAFCPFPTTFLKDIFLYVVKTQDCVYMLCFSKRAGIAEVIYSNSTKIPELFLAILKLPQSSKCNADDMNSYVQRQ